MNEVEEIKTKLDIVEVIGDYVPLKQAGRNFKGLSPFKQEKTPSFMVSSEKGIWHDFSSGEGGDVFSFVMRMEGIEFREALEMLARRAGVVLKPRSRGAQDNTRVKNRLYEATDAAVKYYHLTLSRNPTALRYLKDERALGADVIKRYLLGYAPDKWEALSPYLVAKGFTIEELKSAGLSAQKSGRDNVFDLFRGRIMFPVHDNQGRTIGFSARILTDAPGAPKYINTTETPIYHKGTAIYGLYQAKEAIRQQDEVIVVEGNMDVLGLANAGVQNVVAVSGTALTSDQLRILSRLTKNIKLCFDSDAAGVAATQRAIALASGLDIRLYVITLEGAKDPDELVRRDKVAWGKAVKAAQYAPDYLFEYAATMHDPATAVGKKQLANFVIPTLRQFDDSIEQDHYIKKLANMIEVSEDSIRRKIRSEKPDRIPETPNTNKNSVQQSEPEKMTKMELLERNILEISLAYPITRESLDELNTDIVSSRYQKLFAYLKKHHRSDLERLSRDLHDMANDAKVLTLRGEELYRNYSDHDIRLEAYSQVHRLQKLNIQLNKRRLTQAIRTAEASGEHSQARRLLAEYQALLNEE